MAGHTEGSYFCLEVEGEKLPGGGARDELQMKAEVRSMEELLLGGGRQGGGAWCVGGRSPIAHMCPSGAWKMRGAV